MTIVEAIQQVVDRKSLLEREAFEVMDSVMSGEATSAQIAALLVALRMKGETVPEITGFAKAMRARVVPLKTQLENILDTCGTGGDRVKTFNISTAAAIIASSCGVVVAKHGNRSVTSKCGSADVLEDLGVRLDLTPEQASKILDETGLVFLFAPNYHPAMKHAVGPRKEVRLRTVFNVLGPLTNPAGAKRQLLGVYDARLVPKMANVLRRLGCQRGAVVHGMIGMDEIAPVGTTQVGFVERGKVSLQFLQPSDFGIEDVQLSEIMADETVAGNASLLKLAISEPDSAACNAALPSAGMAVWLGGLSDDFLTGTKLARKAVADGRAKQKLQDLIDWTRRI